MRARVHTGDGNHGQEGEGDEETRHDWESDLNQGKQRQAEAASGGVRQSAGSGWLRGRRARGCLSACLSCVRACGEPHCVLACLPLLHHPVTRSTRWLRSSAALMVRCAGDSTHHTTVTAATVSGHTEANPFLATTKNVTRRTIKANGTRMKERKQIEFVSNT